MSAHGGTGSGRIFEERAEVMTTSRRWTWGRIAALGVAAGMMLMLAGDRSAFTAVPGGIDPLEILNLQIRANAIIILDSSGSMGETLAAGDLAGDDPDSKLYLAKQTLKQVIADNQRKVSFQFGQYEQPGIGAQGASVMTTPNAGLERFLYSTTSVKSASMGGNELVVDLRSYNVPTGTRVEFTEGATTRTSADLTAGRYPTALALAAEVQTRMNATPGRINTYTVSYDDARRFVFTKTAGAQTFSLRWTTMVNLRNLMHPAGANQGPSGTGNPATFTTVAQPNDCSAGGTCDLKRRAAGDSRFTEGTTTFYKLYARRFFNGQRLRVRPSGVVCTVTGFTAAGIPQTGLGGTGQFTVDTDLDGTPDDYDRPWVELERADAACAVATGANAQVVRFTFSSVPRGSADNTYFPDAGEWRTWGGSTTCGGFESLVSLQPCTNNAQFALIAPFLENEIRIDAGTHFPLGYAEAADGTITTQPSVGGMRAAGNTPIAESIADVRTTWATSLWPTISAYGGGSGPFPKTFLIFLTDGDDTCETPDGDTGVLTADQEALRAAHRAQVLYASIDTSNATRANASSVPTFVIAFGTGASATRTNWIAWGGSGMVRATTNFGGQVGLVWSSTPTLADRAACATCRDAFLAADAKQLADALQIAIDQGQTGGTFSDQQSVTESIFELTFLVPQGGQPEPFDPRNPQTRYDTTLPVLLQSTFDMPDFGGHLKAFRNSGPPLFTSVQVWDAGQKLFDRVVTNGMTAVGQWSFNELRGGTGTTDVTIRTSTAKIKRRVYSTSRNGVFGVTVDNHMDGVSPSRVTLWPPDATVDPVGAAGSYPAGVLDNVMGVGAASVPPLTFAQLQTRFGACTSSVVADLHADCAAPATTATQLARARKEAREIILAHMAGANLIQVGGLSFRRALDKELLFRSRPWILAESTLAAPAVAGAPAQTPPTLHQSEYTLYRDGPRAADGTARDGLSLGFGLRNPDDDASSRTDTAPGMDNRTSLKPVMSVAYHAANDMLHAFRAGPCRDNSGNDTCLDSTIETGGEELWGFVPYDALGTLKDRMGSQKRNPHTYVIASAVRLADIFVPGTFSRTISGASVSGDGLWRTVIYFGRGIGGKFITALDVTAPGSYTRSSLQTAGPIALWSRGNPDTQNGTPAGTPNNSTSGNTDLAAYRDMGETWSVPAIAPVKASDNTTPRRATGVDFVAYVGSGFGDTTGCATGVDPCEGKRFYTLDALTGDVVRSYEVLDRTGTNPFPNALVAGPAAFNPERLKFQTGASEVNPALDLTTRVYFVDIHGRVHAQVEPTAASPTRIQKVLADVNDTASTVLHPLGVAPALLNYADPDPPGGLKPHIYVESGNDNRIFPPDADPATTPPFRLFGLRDDDLVTDPDGSDQVAGPVKVLFVRDFPNLYRGSVQPATAFTGTGQGRVFFAGSRFNPPGTTFAPPPPPCRSSFDSILFALGANSGNAAYDLNASGQDEYIQYQSQKIQAVQVKGGILVVDRGLGAEVPPPPPAPPEVLVPPTSGSVYQGLSIPSQFRVSSRSVPFQMGSAVCR
jgi:hypothetical protein